MNVKARDFKNWLTIDYTESRRSPNLGLVRTLLVGTIVLSAIGLVELVWGNQATPLVLPAGAFSLSLWSAWMLWKRKPRPIPIVLFGSAYSLGYVFNAARQPETGDLTDTAPIIILVAVALVLTSIATYRRKLLFLMAALLLVAVLAIQWSAGNNAVAVVTETATSMVVLGIAMFMIAESHRSTEGGRDRYDRLLEEAPLGVIEMDVSETRAVIRQLGLAPADLAERLISDDSLAMQVTDSIEAVHVNRLVRKFANAADSAEAERRFRKGGAHPINRKFLATFVLDTILKGQNSEYVLPFGNDRYMLSRWWLHEPEGNRITALLVDISAQKRIERSLAGEIDTKNQFIASVSHELRTPLTAVVGLVEELANDQGHIGDEERRELLDIVARQSRDVAGIVEDLLVAARAGAGELTIVNQTVAIGELIESILPIYGKTIGQTIEDGLMASGDPVRIRQIVRNLLTNSERYGGVTRRILAYQSGNTICIEIRDSGGPIPTSKRDLMFAPYERVHNRPGQPESVGLGLTVSRDLARMMSGDLTYDHDGQESVFRLGLPVA